MSWVETGFNLYKISEQMSISSSRVPEEPYNKEVVQVTETRSLDQNSNRLRRVPSVQIITLYSDSLGYLFTRIAHLKLGLALDLGLFSKFQICDPGHPKFMQKHD
jgi:hypothetical protein